jgi:hypothetical protein
MWFRVASILGKSVAETQRDLEYVEFLKWCEFYNLEPWGFNAENLYTGIIASTIDNCRMFSKPRHKFAKPKDYMILQDTKESGKVEDVNMKLMLSGIPVIDKREKK